MSQPAQSTDSRTNVWKKDLGVKDEDQIETDLKSLGIKPDIIKQTRSFLNEPQEGPGVDYWPVHLVPDETKLEDAGLTIRDHQVILWIVGTVSDCHLNVNEDTDPRTFSISVKPFKRSVLKGAASLLDRYGQSAPSSISGGSIKVERLMAKSNASKVFKLIFDARNGYDNTTKSDEAKRLNYTHIEKEDVVLVEALLSQTPSQPVRKAEGDDNANVPTAAEESHPPSTLPPADGSNQVVGQPITTVPSASTSTATQATTATLAGVDASNAQPTAPEAKAAATKPLAEFKFRLVDIILLADNPKKPTPKAPPSQSKDSK